MKQILEGKKKMEEDKKETKTNNNKITNSRMHWKMYIKCCIE